MTSPLLHSPALMTLNTLMMYLQADHLLDLLKEREGISAVNGQLHEQMKAAKAALVLQEARAQAAEARAQEAEKRMDYVTVGPSTCLMA